MTSTTAIPDLHLLPDYKWTLEQYHQMIAAGVLTENHRVELLFGKIVATSPIGRSHAACVKQLNRYFHSKFGEEVTIGIQDPVTLVDDSEPEPDVSILKFREDNYVAEHPQGKDILLLIEVADQTLQKDRTVKKTAYALGGVPEYWIINLVDRQVEQYLGAKATGEYDRFNIIPEAGTIESPRLGQIEVKNLLP